MYTLDQNDARRADNRSQVITEAGAYEGVITRAEKLQSEKGSVGFGISFKSESGATANYLDLYTHNAKGEKLPSKAIVDAILCCTRMRELNEGEIEIEKWDKEAKTTYKKKVNGYPQLIGKKIGFILQQEMQKNIKTGSDVERVVIYGVYESGTNFTASEILDKATNPERLEKMIAAVEKNPVVDRRTNKSKPAGSTQSFKQPSAGGGNFDDFDDDIPF